MDRIPASPPPALHSSRSSWVLNREGIARSWELSWSCRYSDDRSVARVLMRMKSDVRHVGRLTLASSGLNRKRPCSLYPRGGLGRPTPLSL